MPFVEEGCAKLLKKMIYKKKIFATSKLDEIKKCKYIIVCIGTPIDNKFKPDLEKFFNFFNNLKKYLNKDKFQLQLINKKLDFVPWTLSIKINNKFTQIYRDKVIKILYKKGIEARNGFYSPSELPIFPKKKLTNCLMLSRRIICLPFYEGLTETKVKYICSTLDKILKY